jgi:hypothetical protein
MSKQRRKFGVIVAIAVAIGAGVAVTHHRASGPAAPAAGVEAPPGLPSPSQPAIDALMALPELKAWSESIETKSHGSAHGAIIAGAPSQQRIVDDQTYQSFTFVESDPDAAHFWQGFYVTANGNRILVEDPSSGELMTVAEWRQKDHPLERIK